MRSAIGRKVEQKQIERAAVEAIVKSGGKVLYDFQQVTDEPSGPKWLRSVLGEYFFSEVDEVDLNIRTGVDCAGLRSLKALPHLQSLVLTGRVGDAELEDLNGLTRLQKLLFATTNVTDSGLIHLERLTSLRELYLSSARITDSGLIHLKDLAQLQVLDLRGTNVTDAGLVDLKGLTQLQSLILYGTKVSEAGLRNFGRGIAELQDRPPARTASGCGGAKRRGPAAQIGWPASQRLVIMRR